MVVGLGRWGGGGRGGVVSTDRMLKCAQCIDRVTARYNSMLKLRSLLTPFHLQASVTAGAAARDCLIWKASVASSAKLARTLTAANMNARRNEAAHATILTTQSAKMQTARVFLRLQPVSALGP